MKRKTSVRLLGVAIMAAAITPWLGGVASADLAVSGDPRATAHDGNAVTCLDAGLAGTDITASVTHTDDGKYIDITAVPAGKSVTGVVVKGGNAYNVYLPGALGALPWLDLHAPLNGSEGPAGLSHYYICGVDSPPPSSPPVTTPPATTSTTPASVAPTTAAASPSTSVKAVKNAKPPAVLPKTGSGMSLGTGLAISLGLLLGGAALMFGSGRLAVAKGKRRH